jgi:acyl-CoA synthetase (NDP forming)
VEAAALLSAQPLPGGRRVAIVSNAGGTGVLAADACADVGLTVAVLGDATQRRLTALLPAGAAVSGPVDTTAAVSADTFRACLEEVDTDDAVDGLIAIGVPTAIADLTSAVTAAKLTKPISVALLDQPDTVRLLTPSDVPSFAYPESAVRALGHAARYRAWRDRQRGRVPELTGLDPAGARAVVRGFLSARPDGGWVSGADAARLLSCYQIPMVATLVVGSAGAAVAGAADLGQPVALKAEIEGIVPHSGADAIRLDLRTADDVATAYDELADQFGARLLRVRLQPMLAGGVETLVGVVQEPVFGPLVVFGLGGPAAEVLGDTTARLSPLTDADAEEMISGGRAASLLTGHRGVPAVDTARLADILLRVSRLADDLPEVVELSLNPVIARPKDVQVADAAVRIAPATPRDPFLRRLR